MHAATVLAKPSAAAKIKPALRPQAVQAAQPAHPDLAEQVLATFKRAQALGRYGHAECVRMTARLLDLTEQTVLAFVPPRTATAGR